MIEQKLDQTEFEDEQIHFLDILIIIARRKRCVLIPVLVCVCIGLVLSFVIRPVFTAKTTILPPSQNQASNISTILGKLGGISAVASGMAGLKDPNELYVGMLESRTVADNLAARFNLKNHYEVKFSDDVRTKLKGATNIVVGKGGIITISFSDNDPAFAAQIANGYVDELKKLTGTLATTQASKRRLFFGKQLQIAKQQLSNAEERLKSVQEQSGVLTLNTQVQASINGLAQLKANLAAKEIQLQAMQTFATTDNPDYQRLAAEIAGLKGQLDQLQEKSADGFLATQKIPEAGLVYVRTLRDKKFAENIYDLMLKQYEMAKVDEANDSSVVQQLDPAVPPERKSKPNKKLIVLTSLILGVVFGLLSAGIAESFERVKNDPLKWDKLNRFFSQLKSF